MSSAVRWEREARAPVGRFWGRVVGTSDGRVRLHVRGLGAVGCDAPAWMVRELGGRVGSWVAVVGQTVDSKEGVFLGLRLEAWEPAKAPISFEQMRREVRAMGGDELDAVDVAQRMNEDMA